MSNKTEQVNLRIQSELKSKLSEISDKKGISMSDFIRQKLEEAIISKDKIEHRIASLEKAFSTEGGKLIRRMMYAGANIASIDTGLPLDHCLSITIQTLEEFDILEINMMQLSRADLESIYIRIQEKIKEKLQLSDRAIAFLRVLFASLTGMLYDEHLFDMSPMSVITLERLRKELQ
jgi:hypothetical protein